MIRQRVIILLASIVILTACTTDTLFEKTIVIDPSGWKQDHFLSFSFPVEDTIGQYEISLFIRNDARYNYSNLFLFIRTTAPAGQEIKDTIEIRMADERGEWLGKGIGGKYTREIPYKTQVQFPQKGRYTIEIEQGMREADLVFITDLGLSVNKM